MRATRGRRCPHGGAQRLVLAALVLVLGAAGERRATGSGRRIIGGAPAAGEHRFVTKIERLGGRSTTCTGELISPTWMLTAAHCILNFPGNGYLSGAPAGNTRVVYGCLDVRSADCRVADAQRYVAHPCYTPAPADIDHDDIALIELRAPVEGMDGQFARVDGLHGSVPLADGDPVTLAGFGTTRPSGGGAASPVLLEVSVRKRSKAFCMQQNPSAVRNGWIDFDHVICTGGDAGKDSCNGDSGGPALVLHEGTPWLVGVASIGSELPLSTGDCAASGRLGVYTEVRA